MFGERGIGPGQFINPTGVAVDCHGTLTVTDTRNTASTFLLAAPEHHPAWRRADRQPPPPKRRRCRRRSARVSVKACARACCRDAPAAAAHRLRHALYRVEVTGHVTERTKPRKRKRLLVSLRPTIVRLPGRVEDRARQSHARPDARLRRAMKAVAA